MYDLKRARSVNAVLSGSESQMGRASGYDDVAIARVSPQNVSQARCCFSMSMFFPFVGVSCTEPECRHLHFCGYPFGIDAASQKTAPNLEMVMYTLRDTLGWPLPVALDHPLQATEHGRF